MSKEEDRFILLIEALVGDKYREEYLMNPSFHNSVDTLVRLLPMWIDGLASEGARVQARAVKDYERLSNMPPGMWEPWTKQ